MTGFSERGRGGEVEVLSAPTIRKQPRRGPSCIKNSRTVDENFDKHEDSLWFYEVHNVKSGIIVAAINNIILRFNLSFKFCYGQIYDGASNMVAKKVVLLLKY